MHHTRFQTVLGLVLAALFAAFWLWHSPGLVRGALTSAEIDRYLSIVEKLPTPPEERAMVVKRLRAWAEADDGKPVYMLNLMRYHEQLRRFPGAADFAGTPQQANSHYEDAAVPLLLASGSYPLFGSETQGGNLIEHQPALDGWGRVLVVRYASRRAFLELLTHPDYAKVVAYKFMALQVLLLPTGGDLIIPDLRWPVGGALLAIFLGVGWWRAARRSGKRELPTGAR